MFKKIKLCFALATLCLSYNSFGWGITGHRVVAEIAQHHLTAKAKTELSKLIGKGNLALWANWADYIKSDTTHQWDSVSKWHYVDIAGNLPKDSFVIALKNLTGKNLYTQIPEMIKEIKNRSLPIQQRQIALRLLIHFIGDLHQPLHVGRPEDEGGNKITVYWFDRKTNLHSVWDASLIDFQQYSYTEYANQLDIASLAEENKWKRTSLDDWFYESHSIADKIYSLTPAESKLSYRYNYLFKSDLDNQLLKGGIRLAKILNDIFK
ncbi:MAG: S1/P1 nuclease [Bacteroidota bacterium]|nr:S1/P1 nuclease [Bacteroidota bacterium]